MDVRQQRDPGLPRRRRGRVVGAFTLIEALFASAVLTLVVGGVAQAMISGQAVTYHALHEGRALALAEALMEEVVRLPSVDPEGHTAAGPDAGESTRSQFDAVDDFADYREVAGGLRDAAGQLLPTDYQAFEREVRIGVGGVAAGPLGAARDAVEIEVVVREPGGQTWRLTRSRAGALQ